MLEKASVRYQMHDCQLTYKRWNRNEVLLKARHRSSPSLAAIRTFNAVSAFAAATRNCINRSAMIVLVVYRWGPIYGSHIRIFHLMPKKKTLTPGLSFYQLLLPIAAHAIFDSADRISHDACITKSAQYCSPWFLVVVSVCRTR